jgi:hypothetical protein
VKREHRDDIACALDASVLPFRRYAPALAFQAAYGMVSVLADRFTTG